MKVLDNLARDGAGHRRAALGDIYNRFEQLRRGTRFDQIAAGPGFQRPENAFAVLIHRQHNDLQCGENLFECGDAINARHGRKTNIHQHHVRFPGRN